MVTPLKRLLNKSEESTHLELIRSLSTNTDSLLHPKVRVADVVDISTLAKEHQQFALMAHFDFLITDIDYQPLFAVEFDGPYHCNDVQKKRDLKKDAICMQHNFPLLRIKDIHLKRKYRGKKSLLYWIIDVYFLSRSFEDAYKKGFFPLDEYFDPMFVISDPIDKTIWPYQLAHDVRLKLMQFEKKGLLYEGIASGYMGVDEYNVFRGCKLIRLDQENCIYIETAMKAQNFPVELPELFEEILLVTLGEHLDIFFHKNIGAISFLEAKKRVERIYKSTTAILISSSGDMTEFFDGLRNK